MAQTPYKILVVDDDRAFLTMISALLSSLRDTTEIETARSGKECLQKIKSFSPNLVFLDIGMDGMNGLVTLRFIKSINKTALVFFLSGLPVEFLKDAVGMVQADGYYTKTQFLDVINSKQSLEEILLEGKSHA